MVEFALVSTLFLALVFGVVDLSRAITQNSTVAEAARQAARQASAAAASPDAPWDPTPSGACSGTVFTRNATGRGCLRDQQILETARSVMAPLTSTVSLRPGSASTCPTPPAGTAYVCVSPTETAAAPGYADCTAATTALGRAPRAGDLGGRMTEWTSPRFQGCFLVQVTVNYSFTTWTPISAVLGGGFQMFSSSSTITEY